MGGGWRGMCIHEKLVRVKSCEYVRSGVVETKEKDMGRDNMMGEFVKKKRKMQWWYALLTEMVGVVPLGRGVVCKVGGFCWGYHGEWHSA